MAAELHVENFDEDNFQVWKRTKIDCITHAYGHGTYRLIRRMLTTQVRNYINSATLLRSLGALVPSSEERSYNYTKKNEVLCFTREMVRSVRCNFYLLLEACKVCNKSVNNFWI